MKPLLTALLLSFTIGTATAFAQAPTAPAAPPAKMSADEKKAASKACTEQANAKGLHGKERKKFRAACIKSGGKS
jgi:psiF repeat